MIKTLFSACVWVLVGSAPASAQEIDTDDLIARVIEEKGAPAAALIIVTPEGEPTIAVKGVRKAGSPEEAQADDYWHIGSNAKAMTATLALAMDEKDMISLDSTVKEVLGSTFDVEDAWSNVTLRQLLSHRGGVQPNLGRLTMMRYVLFGKATEEAADDARRNVLKGILSKPPAAEPGKEFQYSNLGYTIAGMMLGEAAGTSYEQALKTHLLDPLGMDGVLLGAPDGEDGTFIYGHRGNPAEPAPAGADNPALMAPAGTFSVTAESYARFLQDQLRGQMDLETAMLDLESYDVLAEPVGTYALGWGITEEGRLRHSGSNTMWMVTTVVAPEQGIAASILTNNGAVEGLGTYLDEVIEARTPLP